jgi:hypothetical protein
LGLSTGAGLATLLVSSRSQRASRSRPSRGKERRRAGGIISTPLPAQAWPGRIMIAKPVQSYVPKVNKMSVAEMTGVRARLRIWPLRLPGTRQRWVPGPPAWGKPTPGSRRGSRGRVVGARSGQLTGTSACRAGSQRVRVRGGGRGLQVRRTGRRRKPADIGCGPALSRGSLRRFLNVSREFQARPRSRGKPAGGPF